MDISDHYSCNLDLVRILEAIKKAYPTGASKYQLAPIDQLHIGGIRASEKLLTLLNDSERVLEVGSGTGGLMRLASELGIKITGLDISHRLNYLNHFLWRLSYSYQLQPQCGIVTGDAHNLPFSNDSFNAIVLQHSLLNMPDTKQVMHECYRVLQQSGRLILHEIIQGDKGHNMLFPVPWASSAGDSFLHTEKELQILFNQAGFKVQQVSDWTDEALIWRKKQAEKESDSHNCAVLEPSMLLGDSFAQMAENVMNNLSTGSIKVMEMVLSKKS